MTCQAHGHLPRLEPDDESEGSNELVEASVFPRDDQPDRKSRLSEMHTENEQLPPRTSCCLATENHECGGATLLPLLSADGGVQEDTVSGHVVDSCSSQNIRSDFQSSCRTDEDEDPEHILRGNVQCEVPLPRASDHEQESSFLSPANTKGGSTTEHRPKVRLCSLDLLIRVPESCGPQETVREVLGDRSPKEEGKEPLESTTLLLEEDNLEKECPICTELYDSYNHKQSFLNCKHMLCRYCIKTIMDKSNQANMGRLTCPICRQKTPMLQWEICKLQDQLMDSGGTQIQQVEIPPEPLVRRPGLCGALEYRFQKRFYTTRMFTFAPCFRYPVRFINLLHGLERRCRCLYLCVLAFLLCVETVCFFVVFLPIVILVLFIVFSK